MKLSDIKGLKETAYNFLTEDHELEYLEILDKNTLEEQEYADSNSIVLIACRVENVRLIDNIYLED